MTTTWLREPGEVASAIPLRKQLPGYGPSCGPHPALPRHGLEGRVRDINFRAVKLAREAREISGEPVFLAGSVGPNGQQLEPIGRITIAQATAAFEEQIAALLEGGSDLLVLETFTNLPELLAAVSAA